MTRNLTKAKLIVLTGMMTAIIAVLSIVQIPMPTGVPITLQTFAVALSGYVLGPWMGAATALLYMLLGLVGIPVFSGFTAGPGVLFGVTGGFIWGFILMATLCGIGARMKDTTAGFVLAIAFGVLGLLTCHLLGVLQFSMVTKNSIPASILMVSVPYLIKDVASVIGANLVGMAVRKALKAAGVLED